MKGPHLRGDKARPPEETVAEVRQRLAGLRLEHPPEDHAHSTPSRLDIPVYISICGQESIRTIAPGSRGKGSTAVQAEAERPHGAGGGGSASLPT